MATALILQLLTLFAPVDMTPAELCGGYRDIHSGGKFILKPAKVDFACDHADEVIEAAKASEIDPLILSAIIYYESRWVPTAVSRAGCCGLTQVHPKYSKVSCAELKNPVTAIFTGANSLRYWIVKRNKKNYKTALACYNAGNACLSSAGGARYSRSVRKLARMMERSIDGLRTQE